MKWFYNLSFWFWKLLKGEEEWEWTLPLMCPKCATMEWLCDPSFWVLEFFLVSRMGMDLATNLLVMFEVVKTSPRRK
jgi:hypothetical protein